MCARAHNVKMVYTSDESWQYAGMQGGDDDAELKRIRLYLGLKVQQFAALIGVHHTTLYRRPKGRRSIETMEKARAAELAEIARRTAAPPVQAETPLPQPGVVLVRKDAMLLSLQQSGLHEFSPEQMAELTEELTAEMNRSAAAGEDIGDAAWRRWIDLYLRRLRGS